jgi:hypothetical protein
MDKELAKDKIIQFYSSLRIYDRNITDINEIIRIIIRDHFGALKNWEWHDYSDATRILCCSSCIVSFDMLSEWELEKTFLDSICTGLRMAGKELGYDFKGMSTIRSYAEYLPKEYLWEILRHEESVINGYISNNFRTDVISALIGSSSLKDDEKCVFKFRFFDSYEYVRLIVSKVKDSFAVKRPDYRYSTMAQLKEQERIHQNTNEEIFLCGLENNENVVLVKLDRMLHEVTLSLTPNTDVNKMEYSLDIIIGYEDGQINISCGPDAVEHPDLLTLPFDYSDWTPIQEKQLSELDGIMTKWLGDNERETFELVCFYGRNIHGIPERKVYFREGVVMDTDDGKLVLRVDPDKSSMPKDFFGDTVNNICAVIGKNGSGKSSVFRALLHSPIFCAEPDTSNDRDGSFFLLYCIGKNYYYSSSADLTVDFEDSFLNKFGPATKRNDPVGANICYISNTFDIFSFDTHSAEKEENSGGKLSGFIDISTSSLLQTMITSKNTHGPEAAKYDVFREFQKQERERIQNLKDFMAKRPGQDWKFLDLKEIELPAEGLPQISSGEYARWSLFARILSVFYRGDEEKSVLPEIRSATNYIILFDGAELYMHPQWQRCLINDIILFLEAINKPNRYFSNITLLFSSNSPFLMSDLPTEHIRRFSDDDHETSLKSFGQNIFDILKDQFFMPDGTIGEFAISRIKKAFEIDPVYCEAEEKRFLDYVAENVGDRIIARYIRRHQNQLDK